MHILVAVLLLTVPVLGQMFSDLNEKWEDWKTKHQMIYQDQDEMAYRRMVWEKNLKLIVKHNQEASAGLHTFTMGLNHLADMTTEEINSQLNGAKMDNHIHFDNVTFEQTGPTPPHMNWTERGRVSPVRNQGKCHSCWAFAVLGALEGQMKRYTGILIPLSPQNLIDCSIEDGNLGCKGGYISGAFNYIIRNKGVDSEIFYPYEKKNGECRYSKYARAAYCYGYQALPPGNENTLMHSVAAVGPVVVMINANLASFHKYKGDVYDDEECSSSTAKANHAVLVVGYGTDNHTGQDYWLVKNSYGTGWGEGGYIRMARNKNNLCGIANVAVYPKVPQMFLKNVHRHTTKYIKVSRTWLDGPIP